LKQQIFSGFLKIARKLLLLQTPVAVKSKEPIRVKLTHCNCAMYNAQDRCLGKVLRAPRWHSFCADENCELSSGVSQGGGLWYLRAHSSTSCCLRYWWWLSTCSWPN